MNDKNKPIKQYRVGGVSAAIWKREHEGKTFYSVTLDRSYKDADGDWKRTSSFDAGDALIAARLAEKAATYLLDILLDQ